MRSIKSSDTNLIELGLKIRALRLFRKLSQEELSDKANIHRTYISDLEQGQRNPTVATLKKVADALGVKIKDFWD